MAISIHFAVTIPASPTPAPRLEWDHELDTPATAARLHRHAQAPRRARRAAGFALPRRGDGSRLDWVVPHLFHSHPEFLGRSGPAKVLYCRHAVRPRQRRRHRPDGRAATVAPPVDCAVGGRRSLGDQRAGRIVCRMRPDRTRPISVVSPKQLYIRGDGFWAEARRERRAYPEADL